MSAFKRIRKNARNGFGSGLYSTRFLWRVFSIVFHLKDELDIKMRKKIIVCRYCGRIMIDPELAGVKDVN